MLTHTTGTEPGRSSRGETARTGTSSVTRTRSSIGADEPAYHDDDHLAPVSGWQPRELKARHNRWHVVTARVVALRACFEGRQHACRADPDRPGPRQPRQDVIDHMSIVAQRGATDQSP